jgi:hypothetical protein
MPSWLDAVLYFSVLYFAVLTARFIICTIYQTMLWLVAAATTTGSKR